MTNQIYPKLSESELGQLASSAEAKFYRACRDQLGDEVLVIHSLSLFSQTRDGGHSVGECDFAIFDPNHGVLVVEVKGGGIAYMPENEQGWCSVDRHGVQHAIQDPFKQSEKYRFKVLDLVKNTILNSKKTMFPAGHSVAFPDLSFSDLKNIVSHNRPRNIIACSDDLKEFKDWYIKSINYWNAEKDSKFRLGKENVKEIARALLRPVYARPTLVSDLESLENERILLTDEQSRLLFCLGDRKRANITGGAGTGKTVVAQRLAENLDFQNHKTALICYNRALGGSLREATSSLKNVTAGSYHSFFQLLLGDQFKHYYGKAKENDSSGDEWDAVRPLAYALYLEDKGSKFDALVIDEAQDFKPDFWMAIDLLLSDNESSPYFLFSDTNQQIFSNSKSIPRLSPDFLLYSNCRNTNHIHKEAYKTYSGPNIVPSEMSGQEVYHCDKKMLSQQVKYILEQLNSLVSDQKALPESIFILIAKSTDFYNKIEAIRSESPNLKLNLSEFPSSNKVGVSTIQKFKGLESDIVFVWGINDIPDHDISEMRYVGASRAKSILFLVD